MINGNLRYKILVPIFLFICLNANSDPVDSTVFNNNYEMKVLLNYISVKKEDPLKLFIAINYNAKSEEIIERLTVFYMNLEKNGIRSLNKKKQIKEIYKKVHSTFFQKYTEEVYFSDIFTNGNYNCVTASALYALVFDHFNIDYSIKKAPEHVYLIADPNGEQIAIETTLPANGLFVYDDRYKKGYVDYLSENKLISENEYKTKSIDELFEQNYNQRASINLYQLAALQYYNFGVVYYNSLNYNDALKCFEKAELLYDDKAITFLKSATLQNILNEQNSKKKYSGKTLAKYLNANKKSSTTIDYADNIFSVVSNELVINHPNVSEYKQYFNDLITSLSDSINKNDFYHTYNELLGYYYYTSSDLQKSLYYFSNAYKFNSENIRTRQAITEIVSKYLIFDNDYENRIDSLELYIQKFPFVASNNMVQQFLVYSFSRTITNNFEMGNIGKGKHYLERFEVFIKGNLFKDASSEHIGGLYKSIYSYYYRIHNYIKAEEYLKRGLELVPNSNELQSTYNYFQSSKKELLEWARKNNYSTKDESMSLDNESVSVLNSVAKTNRENVNFVINKYLKKKQWKLESVAVGDKILKFSAKEQVIFSFTTDKDVKIKDEKTLDSGTWSYDKNESMLKIKNSKDLGIMYIMIYEADSVTIKSVVNNEKDAIKAITVFKGF